MKESLLGGLSVVLVNDPQCLQAQTTRQEQWWRRLRSRLVYSGPSFLAQISFPSTASETPPHAVGTNTEEEALVNGLQLARERVYLFRTDTSNGCRGCPVRKVDATVPENQRRGKGGSTCGTLVEITETIIDRRHGVVNGQSMTGVIVRLAGQKPQINFRGKKKRDLLGMAHCAKLIQLNVDPLTSGEGSPTMPTYGQSLKNK